jgi:hypothetical protein
LAIALISAFPTSTTTISPLESIGGSHPRHNVQRRSSTPTRARPTPAPKPSSSPATAALRRPTLPRQLTIVLNASYDDVSAGPISPHAPAAPAPSLLQAWHCVLFKRDVLPQPPSPPPDERILQRPLPLFQCAPSPMGSTPLGPRRCLRGLPPPPGSTTRYFVKNKCSPHLAHYTFLHR